jgi:MerR family transcriptional regulator, mercuric resistance operon regulatory protein
MTISELARRACVGTETIRFYEREGLLARPRKPEQGYRRYGEAHVERVRFIKQCQSFGFSLAEAGQLIEMLERDEASCAEACDLAKRKIGELRKRIAEYEALAGRLKGLLERPCATGDKHGCGLIEELRNVH